MVSLQDPDRAVRIATDLVNTATGGQERLRTPADLRGFLLAHGEPEPVRVSGADLAETWVVRRQLRHVYGAGSPAAAVLNALLAAHATRPYLSDHDGTPWHLHVTAMDAGWAPGLAAISAVGLATLVAAHGFAALRVCAAHDCDVVFVSTAQRRIRRYCGPTCATRARVAAHRQRRREQPVTGAP